MKTLLWCAFLALISPLCGDSLKAPDNNQYIHKSERLDLQSMQIELDWLDELISHKYIPYLWKQEHLKWRWPALMRKAKATLQAKTTRQEFAALVRELICSLSDLHTSVSFYSNPEEAEFAVVPITFFFHKEKLFVKEVQGAEFEGVKAGDELLQIDGEPAIDSFYKKAREVVGEHHLPCARLFLSHYLFFCSAGWNLELPAGQVHLCIKGQDGKLLNKTGKWISQKTTLQSLSTDRVTAPIPDLGEVLDHINTPLFEVLWCQSGTQKVGYIRIKTFFTGGEYAFRKGMAEFESLIIRLQKSTDILVVDLRNNQGGELNFCQGLMSCLTKYHLDMPQRSELIDASVAKYFKARIKYCQDWEKNGIPSQLGSLRSCDRHKTIRRYGFAPLTLPVVHEMHQYFQAILDQYSSGNRVSRWNRPLSALPPNTRARYDKPLIVLINEVSCSASELMASTLQDNNRAIVFGSRSSGGGVGNGGAFHSLPACGPFLIKSLRLPTLFLRRINNELIENCGVDPDVVCELTWDDYLKTGVDYSRKLRDVIGQICDAHDDSNLSPDEKSPYNRMEISVRTNSANS